MTIFSFPAQVNEYAARLVATFVALATLLAVAAQLPWVFPVLAIGFLLRVGWGPRFSPLARAAMSLAPKLWTPKPVAGPPKRFAQGIGAVCMIGASAFWFAGMPTGTWILAAMILVFATLEASVAFCMGCWIYGRLQQAGFISLDVCVDCAPQKQVGSG